MKSETVCELKTAEDLLKLNWLELEIRKSALHEAAHTVIARLTGLEVAWVSLDPDFIRNDPLAILNCSAHANERTRSDHDGTGGLFVTPGQVRVTEF